MTEPIYLTDSERQQFEATVERSLDDRIVLDRTAFYPAGGGQPADHGTVTDSNGNQFDVTDVSKTDTIYHHIDGTPPEAGSTVTGQLNWERRFGHMRHHTAQHLLSAVLLSEFDAETTGNQVYTDRARLDCAYDRFSETDLDDIEAALNEHVEAALNVDWYELDRDTAEKRLDTDRTRIDLLPDSITEIRLVEIDGVDRTACAGTHVSSTDEIGEVRVTGRETKGSDEERITFEVA